MTPAQLAHRVNARQVKPGQWLVRCPVHDDKQASCSIGTGEKHSTVVRCHAGCPTEAVMHAWGLTTRDLFNDHAPTGRTPRQSLNVVATYEYRDADGTLLQQVLRLEPKGFKQRRPDPSSPSGWEWKRHEKQVIYRLPEVLASSGPVLFVEGEKDADNAWAAGLPATTVAGGSGTCWSTQFADPLRGREVWVIPDNDDVGKQFARRVAAGLHGFASSVRVVELPGVAAKGDLSDWFAAGGTPGGLRAQAAETPTYAPDAKPPEPASEPPPADAPTRPQRRALRSRSFLTAVEIIEQNLSNVLSGRALRWNEMLGKVMLGDALFVDADVAAIRAAIERHFDADASGTRGLQFAKQDVADACEHVARARPFHPVREYLERLRWDGTPRIAQLPEALSTGGLNDDAELVEVMLRRFLIAAVARVLQPGCKVDNMLILQGAQGARKSTLMRVLGGRWFLDSAFDIHSKDAFATIRHGWIIEWAELEVLKRARDVEAVKNFLSKGDDTYRPSYARYDVQVLRTCVFVGTTNEREFLTDPTGERRYWPVRVGAIDTDWVATNRDQLWAEAVALYRSGVPWHLSPAEDVRLKLIATGYKVGDAWAQAILGWAEHQHEFTSGDVLEKAIAKPTGQWTTHDARRVASVLRGAGYEQRQVVGGSRVWRKA